MYAFGRPLHGLLCGLAVLLGLGLVEGNGHWNAGAQPTEKGFVEAKKFSRQWAEEYYRDALGCEMGRGSYTWRGSGFGSNINHLLNAWVYTLAAEGWSDLAVIMGDNQLRGVECSHESKGLVSHGWSCLFSSMPHLCVFDTPEVWQRHMNSSGVSEKDQIEAAWFSITTIASADFSTPLGVLGIDQLRAKAVMAKLLWRSMTPWLRRDVHAVTHAKETFHRSPFIAIHVRRGDKIRQNSSLWQDTEAYLAVAVKYLEGQPGRVPADRIKGIWVASDDETVLKEVRSLAHAYFPNVRNEDIVYVAGGVPGGVRIPNVTTVSMRQVYASFVYLMADFEQLAAADVFVGTFSSNVGRLVMLLREGAGKARSSCISLDYAWKPNRQLSHELG